MGSPPEIAFDWHDAWLLLAVAIGGGADGASLRDVLATGDYINHDIFLDG